MPDSPRRISIITPCYNAAPYLRQCIESVLSQNYPNLEFIIVDGGSTDGSAEIIKQYADKLAWWVSERDGGQYSALNKGFAKSTGEILGWINADDFLLPNAITTIAGIYQQLPEVQWLTSRTIVNCDDWGVMSWCGIPGASREAWSETTDGTFIMQEATFWTRRLFADACGLQIPTRHSHAADQDLWLQFFAHSDLYLTDVPLACSRQRSGQRSRDPQYMRQANSIRLEAREKWGTSPQASIRRAIFRYGLNRRRFIRGLARRAVGYPITVVKRKTHSDAEFVTSDNWILTTDRWI